MPRKPRAQSCGDSGIWIRNFPHRDAEIRCPDCTRQVSSRLVPWPCPLNREPRLSVASPFSSGRFPTWHRPPLVTSFLRLALSCHLVPGGRRWGSASFLHVLRPLLSAWGSRLNGKAEPWSRGPGVRSLGQHSTGGAQTGVLPPILHLLIGFTWGLMGTPTTLVAFTACAPPSPNHCREKHGPDGA